MKANYLPKRTLSKFLIIAFLMCCNVPGQQNIGLYEFVTIVRIDGFDYDAAKIFNSSELERIIPLLRDDDFSEYWLNVCYTIGILGNERHVDILTSFIKNGSGKSQISSHELNARMAAITALGILGNRKVDGAIEKIEQIYRHQIIISGEMNGKSLYDLFPDSIYGLCIGALGLCASDKALEIIDKISKEIPENQILINRIKTSKEKLAKLKNGEIDYVEAIDKSYREHRNIKDRILTESPVPEVSGNIANLELDDAQVKNQSTIAFREITRLAINGNLDSLIYRLADNGEPILKSSLNNSEEKVNSMLENEEWKREFDRLNNFLIRFRDSGHLNDLEQYNKTVERTEGRIVCKVYLRNSKDIIEELSINRHHKTVGNQNEVIIYMIYIHNKWYWNPPGW